MKIGDIVKHREHRSLGVGTIIARWGAWFSCPECYAVMAPNPKKKKKNKFANSPPKVCPECNLLVQPLSIDGNDVFDVCFGGDKPRSINQCWLEEGA